MEAERPAPCPGCGKPAAASFAPFCSRRCQQVDLARWLKGDFVIPGRTGEAPPPEGGTGEEE